MIIKAVVQLQALGGSLAFVAKGGRAWGSSEVRLYEVTAESWSGVQRVLKGFDVIGAHRCKSETVVSFTRDIGKVPEKFRPLPEQVSQ